MSCDPPLGFSMCLCVLVHCVFLCGGGCCVYVLNVGSLGLGDWVGVGWCGCVVWCGFLYLEGDVYLIIVK